ncbi:quinol oxidase subunit 2 [Alicyclobacillus cellulosilyticus]|uniref:Quinol oxidase subunit 2 n=1 Tax=Alicyclobacillus cellulosilyticus TaxID=1003997 RepID=A0A917NKE2_9BACL|nr:ubiquinol oxidase subunit II [Alicyclobacillus cellulosilyticus]GGJ07051.1 quinol oxidase subunit 2 [Alicyclobacillus cellulosilyticus]
MGQREMRRRVTRVGVIAVAAALLLSGCSPQYMVLNPVGPVGKKELDLILLSTVLIMMVILPVLALLFYIVWRYRDKPGNKAPYQPRWSENKVLEVIWWGIPIVVVAILGTATVKTTYALVKPPETNVKPLTVEVVSLDWKWLFLYPDQGVATVNYCEIPTGVPVQFELTSDAPMNSFWVPQLGGQEYTMPGMAMRLWLQADKPGTYYGHGANFTGEGFAHDEFRVVAVDETKFNDWVTHVKQTAPALTKAGYAQLKRPSIMGTASYKSFPPGLFNDTVWADGGQYMPGMLNDVPGGAPKHGMQDTSSMSSRMAQEAHMSS